jgi:hypothetical protein
LWPVRSTGPIWFLFLSKLHFRVKVTLTMPGFEIAIFI